MQSYLSYHNLGGLSPFVVNRAIVAMNRNDNTAPPAMIWATMGYFTINHPYANPLATVTNTIIRFFMHFLLIQLFARVFLSHQLGYQFLLTIPWTNCLLVKHLWSLSWDESEMPKFIKENKRSPPTVKFDCLDKEICVPADK